MDNNREHKSAEMPDLAFIRDVVDIIKNKTLFFIPFFGAFVAFLVAKTDYVTSSNWLIKLLCAASFLGGIWYAYTVSQALWMLESIRLAFTLERASEGDVFNSMTDEQKNAVQHICSKFAPMVSFEDKLFRRTMYLLYTTSMIILFDIFFGKLVSGWVVKLALMVGTLHH